MALSNNKYYKPDEALHELMLQEAIVNTAVDIQALLQILVAKNIITREEVSKYREKVRNSPKYKATLDEIQRQKTALQAAQSNPQEYLKAVLRAKMNGDIK